MRRANYLLLVGLIILTGLFAQADAQESIVLSITCTCNETTVAWINEIIVPAFEEEMAAQGKTAVVELIDLEDTDEQFREQMALDLSLSEGSDIIGFDGFWVPEFVEAGLIKPLNQVAGENVESWEGWSRIPEGVQQILSFEGERYGIPSGTDVRAIFYRRDLFEQAGIETPWQPQSWQDILDTAGQLKASGVEIPLQLDAGTYMGEATTMQGYLMTLLGTGHHLYDFEQQKWIVSSPGILDTLNLYKTIYEDQEFGNLEMQLAENGRELTFEAFRDGRIGMYIESDWFWSGVLGPGNTYVLDNRDELVGWAMMPAQMPGAGYGGQDFVTVSGGTGWILNPNTAYPEEAWLLLSIMGSQAGAQGRQTYQPGISFRDDVEVAGDPVLTEMAEELLPLTTVRPLLPQYPQISYEAQLMTERVITGEMTPEEAMQAYAEAVIAIVGEENVIVLE